MKNLIKIVLLSIIFGGLASIFIDRFLFPYLASQESFQRYAFLKGAVENTTIINKTEEITVKDEQNVFEMVNKVSPSVVSFVSQNGSTLGTGVVLTSDGIILALRDLIYDGEEAREFFVVLNDGSKASPVSIKSNNKEFAIVKIDKINLSAANVTDQLRSGEKILVFGRGTSEEKEVVSVGMANYINSATKIIYGDAKNYPVLFGAGVFNIKGEMVGLNISRGTDVEGIMLPPVSELLTQS